MTHETKRTLSFTFPAVSTLTSRVQWGLPPSTVRPLRQGTTRDWVGLVGYQSPPVNPVPSGKRGMTCEKNVCRFTGPPPHTGRYPRGGTRGSWFERLDLQVRVPVHTASGTLFFLVSVLVSVLPGMVKGDTRSYHPKGRLVVPLPVLGWNERRVWRDSELAGVTRPSSWEVGEVNK